MFIYVFFLIPYCISMNVKNWLGLVRFTKLSDTIGYDYVMLIFFQKIITLLVFAEIALEMNLVRRYNAFFYPRMGMQD